jgi:hypothetical protein
MCLIFKYEEYLARDQTNVDIVNFLPDGKSPSGNQPEGFRGSGTGRPPAS